MLDGLSLAVLASLLFVAFLSWGILIKKFVKEILRVKREGLTIVNYNIKDMFLLALFFPFILFSCMGVFWIVTGGALDELPRVLLLSGGGGFLLAIFLTFIFYFSYWIGRKAGKGSNASA